MCKYILKKDGKRYCELHKKIVKGECLMCPDYKK